EVGLEPGDVAAERRLREPELICGASHMLLAGDDGELPEPGCCRVDQPFMYIVSASVHDSYIGRISRRCLALMSCRCWKMRASGEETPGSPGSGSPCSPPARRSSHCS